MEIFVNFVAMQSCILRLRALRARCSNLNATSVPAGSSDGDVARNLTEILDLYRSTGEALSQIVDKSIAFLENAKLGMQQSDQAASHLIVNTATGFNAGGQP